MTEKRIADYMQEAEKVTEQKYTEEYKPDSTQKHKFKSNIVAQITHFYMEKPNTLQIEFEEPTMKGDFPKRGNITIRLKKEDSNVAMKLNPAESLELSEILKELSRQSIIQTKSLWSSK